MKIYFDNAATTPIDKEVLDVMLPILNEQFGNPSSIHAHGRKTRAIIENARKSIAKLLNCAPAEIFFTSGGTEADNMAIIGSVDDLGIKHVITSAIEHHAVGHTLEHLEKIGKIKLSLVNLHSNGDVDLTHLEELLRNNSRSLVTLMHANNEIGNLLPLQQVGELCKQYDAIFHSDTVQTMGHYKHDMQQLHVHFITGAAHKFHGPKGIGFLYVNHQVKINPLIFGGSQERNMRGGTENVYGIAGLAKALELAYSQMEEHHAHIQGIKDYFIARLNESIPGVGFNGNSVGDSLYTVLNVLFPKSENAEMLLFNLDIAGISASGGSACTSGSNQGSHVLRGIKSDMERPSVRFSFSKYNTKEEVDYTIEKLATLLKINTTQTAS
ncbi:MAG: cysteine desulfurase family protein [Bacteroidota bacterium]|jgi:cysteine desulfurase